MAYWDGERWIDERAPAPKEQTRTRRAFVHTSQALLEGSLVALLGIGLVAGTAFAGKVGGSVNLVMVQDANGNGAPNWADTVTFDVSSTADKPYVNVRCYQGGSLVYDGWAGFYDGAWFGQTYMLESSSWVGGAADCTARLVTYGKNGRERTLTSMDFGVGG